MRARRNPVLSVFASARSFVTTAISKLGIGEDVYGLGPNLLGREKTRRVQRAEMARAPEAVWAHHFSLTAAEEEKGSKAVSGGANGSFAV